MTAGAPIVPLPNLANFSVEINLARVTAQRDKLLAACREAKDLLECVEIAHVKVRGKAQVVAMLRAAIADAEVTP